MSGPRVAADDGGSTAASGQPTRSLPRLPRRARRILVAVGVTLVVAVAGAGVGGALLIRSYDGALARDTLLAPDARAEPPARRAALVGPLNVLLIGSDFRAGNPLMGQRSDTIIIAHLPAELEHVYLVAVPRDLLVEIPPAPSLSFPGASGKINAAFEYGHGGRGGAQLLSLTLTNLVGIRFDAAAVIDFSGLRKAVDVLGGVMMCVDVRTVSVHTGKVFVPGCREMDSRDVLDYLRQRDFPDGDFTRQRHQQQFLKAFLDRARSTGVLANPMRTGALLRAVAGSLTVDTPGAALTDLALALRDLSSHDLTGIKIPFDYAVIDGLSYVVPTADAEGLFAAIRDDAMSTWVRDHEEWVNEL